MAPPERHQELRRELLAVEEVLAVRQSDVGLVPEFEFDLELAEGSRPFTHRATPFPPEKRRWVRAECESLVDSGVLERSAEVDCASNLVLVDKG